MAFDNDTFAIKAKWLCFNLQVLETKQVNESHTGDVLAHHLDATIITWGLHNKVFGATTDNASNMEKACLKSNEVTLQLGCLAHTLNLSAGKASDIIRPVTKHINAVIAYFHRSSTVGMPVLREYQQKLGLPAVSLITECKTRWNSGYLSLVRNVMLIHQWVSAKETTLLLVFIAVNWNNSLLHHPIIKNHETFLQCSDVEFWTFISNTYALS